MRHKASSLVATLLITCLSFCTQAYAASGYQFQIKLSEASGVLAFMESLRDPANNCVLIPKYFFTKHKRTAQDELALRDYASVITSADIIAQKDDKQLYSTSIQRVLERLAAASGSVSAFLACAQAVLPPEDYGKFAKAVRHFAPEYERIIWQPSLPMLKADQASLEATARRVNFNGRLRQLSTMLSSTWPADSPFTVVLVPIPKQKTYNTVTHGHCDDSVEIMEVFDKKDTAGALGVVFHEFCHSLDPNVTSPSKSRLRDTFVDAGGIVPFWLLGEGVACAIGNGWMEKELSGKLSKKEWYHEPYVDGYAQAIYPMVTSYFLQGKALDAEFAKQATKLFLEKFPNYRDDPRLIFWNVVAIKSTDSDSYDLGEILPPESHHYSSTTLSSTNAHKDFSEHPDYTALFTLCPEDLEHLASYGLTNEEIKAISDKAGKGAPFAWSKHTKDRWFVACVGKTETEQVSVLKKLVAAKTIELGLIADTK